MASWSGRGVSIGRVDDALLDLRRGEQRAATRISTINLVVVAEDDADAERARHAMRRLGGRNPGRTVILIPDPDAEANVAKLVKERWIVKADGDELIAEANKASIP